MPSALENPQAAFWGDAKKFEAPPDTSARDGGSKPESMPDLSQMRRLTVEKIPTAPPEQAIDLGSFGKDAPPSPDVPAQPSGEPAVAEMAEMAEVPPTLETPPSLPPTQERSDPFRSDVAQQFQRTEKDLGRSKIATLMGTLARRLMSLDRDPKADTNGVRERAGKLFERVGQQVTAAREGAQAVREMIQKGDFSKESSEPRMNREANIMRAYEALKKTPRLQEEVARIQDTVKQTGLGSEYAELALADKFGAEVAPALVWLMERPQLQGFLDTVKTLNVSPELEEQMLAKKIDMLDQQKVAPSENQPHQVSEELEAAVDPDTPEEAVEETARGNRSISAEEMASMLRGDYRAEAAPRSPERKEVLRGVEALQDSTLSPEDMNQLNAEIYAELLAAQEVPTGGQRAVELQTRGGETVRASINEQYRVNPEVDPKEALQQLLEQQNVRMQIGAELVKADRSEVPDKFGRFEQALIERFGAENVSVEVPTINNQPAQAWTEGMRMRTQLSKDGKITITFEDPGEVKMSPKFESEVAL